MTSEMQPSTRDQPTAREVAPAHNTHRVRRELILAGTLIAVGALLLPMAIYFTGQALLGPYSEGGHGLGRLYGDIYRDLAAGFLPAWLLVLSPWLGIVVLRIALIPLRRRRAAPPPQVTM
jgi:hypothetical protein